MSEIIIKILQLVNNGTINLTKKFMWNIALNARATLAAESRTRLIIINTMESISQKNGNLHEDSVSSELRTYIIPAILIAVVIATKKALDRHSQTHNEPLSQHELNSKVIKDKQDGDSKRKYSSKINNSNNEQIIKKSHDNNYNFQISDEDQKLIHYARERLKETSLK